MYKLAQVLWQLVINKNHKFILASILFAYYNNDIKCLPNKIYAPLVVQNRLKVTSQVFDFQNS